MSLVVVIMISFFYDSMEMYANYVDLEGKHLELVYIYL